MPSAPPRMTTIQQADANVRQQAWDGVKGFFGYGPQPAQTAASPSTPLVSPPAPTMTAAPAPQPAPPTEPQMAGATQPQPIVSNTQGTMTDTQGKPVQTSGPAPDVKPVAFTEIEGTLNDSNIPVAERKQFAEKFVTDQLKQNPELVQGFRDAQAGKNTPQAQAYQAKFKAAQDAHIQQQVQANPEKASTPQGFGEIVNNAIGQFQNMPPAMQAMVGIGLPMGLIGIMSSLFGGGGLGMGIMGALGLGAGVLGGAAGGMFGQGASNMAGDAMFNMGSFLGMVPEKADLSVLKGKDPLANLAGAAGGGNISREEAAKKLTEGRSQAENLRKLMGLPVGDDVKIRLMQRLDPTIDSTEAGQQALQNADTLLKAYDDPKSDLNKMMQQAEWYSKPGYGSAIVEAIGPERAKTINSYMPWNWGSKQSADMNIHKLIEKWAFNDMDAKELSDLKAEKAKGAPYRVDDARREHALNLRSQAMAPTPDEPMMTKKIVVMCMKRASRCWAGYEPVPGKKPYSNDSCRPVGSKKKAPAKQKAKK
jgi:hypothetical protein